jgi:hypothetical protein
VRVVEPVGVKETPAHICGYFEGKHFLNNYQIKGYVFLTLLSKQRHGDNVEEPEN